MTANIAIINESTVVSDTDLQACVTALQTQLDRDFTPIWNHSAKLTFVAKGQKPDPSFWWLAVLDTSDQAGALGYHDLTTAGLPIGKVFAKTDIQYKASWTVTVSHELCLTGDTKIAMLDGTDVPIVNLIGKEEFWVYSCKEDGSLRPGRGHSARLTKKDAKIVKVTLDSGETVRCTADHPFMLRDGTYQEAGKLLADQSLMPLYRRKEKLDRKDARSYEYEQVLNPKTNDWLFTHRMVAPYCSSGYERHHIDFNRFNNSPDNLKVMLWEDHIKVHSQHIGEYAKLNRGKKRNLTAEQRIAFGERGRERLIKYNVSDKHKADMAKFYTPDKRAEVRERLKVYISSDANILRLTEINQSEIAKERARVQITTYNRSSTHREAQVGRGRDMFKRLWDDPDWANARKKDSAIRMKKMMHQKWHVDRNVTKPGCELCTVNHKVVSVEPCGCEDVYDITVDKYHNFALSSGVFVHNCEMMVDPYVGLTVFNQTGDTAGMLYSYEVGDPCEADQFGYKIGNVLVSDFVTPAWFDGWRAPHSAKFDFGNRIGSPLTLLPGGYAGVFKIKGGSGWTQITADKTPSISQRAHVGSRRERRMVGADRWVHSTVA